MAVQVQQKATPASTVRQTEESWMNAPDRTAVGKALRDRVPRLDHAAWTAPPDAMGAFALAYADQAERDHAAMKSAVRAGIIDVELER